MALVMFLAAAQLAMPAPPADLPATLRAEAFVAAQNAMLNDAGVALAQVAARFARGDDAIAALESERDRDNHLLAAADLAAVNGVAGSAAARAQSAAEHDRLRAAIAALDQRIQALDPAYSELTRPRPLGLEETQRLLEPDEALLLVLPTKDAAYVFAITREGADWVRAAIGEDEIDTTVEKLRASIMQDLRSGTETFDRSAAFHLYNTIVRPLEPRLAGKRALMTVAAGALGTLPPQLLVTEQPADARTDDAAMRATHWLIDRYVLTTLPEVSSLRALRCLLVAPDQGSSGCRDEHSRPRDRPKAERPVTPAPSAEFVGFGAPLLGTDASGGRGGGTLPPVAAVYRGGLADAKALRELPSLPGAKAELEMVGSLFPANRADIEIGADATETRLKQSITLQNAQYVLFSTHGLLASESRAFGAAEPGLVFTPPGTSTEVDDGLLTASEAAQLRLSAKLVVLSACNTAASDGTPGAAGLSGLARAFFFAGARALVVSNWTVSDQATNVLVRTLFAGGGAENGRSSAEQLREAELTTRAAPNFASPAYWAPFVLVGTPR